MVLDFFINRGIRIPAKWYLDVPLEVRINDSDQWLLSPTYRWGITWGEINH